MKKAEQSAATRTTLLKGARELFTERGYADTTTEDIAKRAGVTRGALYYQFYDKFGLFRAVFEDLSLHIAQKIASAIQSEQEEQGDLWNQMSILLKRIWMPAWTRLSSVSRRLRPTPSWAGRNIVLWMRNMGWVSSVVPSKNSWTPGCLLRNHLNRSLTFS